MAYRGGDIAQFLRQNDSISGFRQTTTIEVTKWPRSNRHRSRRPPGLVTKWPEFWKFTRALSPNGLRWGVPAREPTGCTAFPKSKIGGKRIAAWSKPGRNAALPSNWSGPANGIGKSDCPANGGMPHSWRSKTAVLGFGDGGRNCGAARIGKPHCHEEKTRTGFAKTWQSERTGPPKAMLTATPTGTIGDGNSLASIPSDSVPCGRSPPAAEDRLV